MTDNSTFDVPTIAREIKSYIGEQEYKRMHQSNRFYDVFAVSITIIVFFSLIFVIGAVETVWQKAFLIVIQGFFIQTMAFISHDIFVHRRLGKDKLLSWVACMILTMARFSVPTGYKQAHLKHHRYLGGKQDTEKYKQHLDTRFRRFLFSTFPGVKMAHGGHLSRETKPYLKVKSRNEKIMSRAKIEQWILRGLLLALLPLAVLFPHYILFGFLVPALLITPIAGTLRIILEHAEVNPDNPYHIATYYRTGIFSQLVFLWDSGDCHLIHHIFPGIPFYRMRRANRLIRPFLLKKGVKERTSFRALLVGWYVKNYSHRSLWSNHNTPYLQDINQDQRI